MKFTTFKRKTSVTCLREDKEHAGKKHVTMTDEANGKVLVETHKDNDSEILSWFRMDKETFLSMVGSLWPEEVAIITEEDEDA